ncbi:unnamed protein product [Nyctereutes procyonoides]|uniref:(raccoon dog) hypothetical protein n=1 Tax=Nyctereutes procyonoides TaxID=34880 RepID=A0A811ZFT6_NYCPR|nr:unnamed protein product [Nyctereutes procyonoides]
MQPEFNPKEIKVIYLRCTCTMSALALKISPLGLSPKKVGNDITKATSDWNDLRVTVKLNVQNRQAQVAVVSSASALIITTLKEPRGDRKKQKNIRLGTVEIDPGDCPVCGLNVDAHHPHDIIDDISSGTVECPTN